jgi:hypothetical protein
LYSGLPDSRGVLNERVPVSCVSPAPVAGPAAGNVCNEDAGSAFCPVEIAGEAVTEVAPVRGAGEAVGTVDDPVRGAGDVVGTVDPAVRGGGEVVVTVPVDAGAGATPVRGRCPAPFASVRSASRVRAVDANAPLGSAAR